MNNNFLIAQTLRVIVLMLKNEVQQAEVIQRLESLAQFLENEPASFLTSEARVTPNGVAVTTPNILITCKES